MIRATSGIWWRRDVWNRPAICRLAQEREHRCAKAAGSERRKVRGTAKS
jgi:hypothetical protein